MGRIVTLLLVAAVLLGGSAGAHPVDRVTIASICRYEENYYVWTAGETWRVWGRVSPVHVRKTVVLQKSKRGYRWDAWKTTTTNEEGRYRFSGVTTSRSGWWTNLRVVFKAQDGHSRTVSRSIYVDNNPATGCG